MAWTVTQSHASQRLLQDSNFLLCRGLRGIRIVVRDTRTVSALRTAPPVPSPALLAEPFDIGAYFRFSTPAATSTSIPTAI